ncbi:hypothetical protein OFN61_36910, partial [Escherichia coli]|nr:hypothetical protein [Escherichia coli]
MSGKKEERVAPLLVSALYGFIAYSSSVLFVNPKRLNSNHSRPKITIKAMQNQVNAMEDSTPGMPPM